MTFDNAVSIVNELSKLTKLMKKLHSCWPVFYFKIKSKLKQLTFLELYFRKLLTITEHLQEWSTYFEELVEFKMHRSLLRNLNEQLIENATRDFNTLKDYSKDTMEIHKEH